MEYRVVKAHKFYPNGQVVSIRPGQILVYMFDELYVVNVDKDYNNRIHIMSRFNVKKANKLVRQLLRMKIIESIGF